MLDKIFNYGIKLFGMFLLPISISYAIHHLVETNYLNCVLGIPLFLFGLFCVLYEEQHYTD